MQEGQHELEQAETSETNVEREISTTEQLNVRETVEESAQRGTPTTTAPFPHRRLSARSHLAPFSFPQVRHVICKNCTSSILFGMYLQILLVLIVDFIPLPE